MTSASKPPPSPTRSPRSGFFVPLAPPRHPVPAACHRVSLRTARPFAPRPQTLQRPRPAMFHTALHFHTLRVLLLIPYLAQLH